MFALEDADLFPMNPENALQLVVSVLEILLQYVGVETENTENFSL
jgi:hypothetical protein